MNGTGKQFEVTWDSGKGAINILLKKAYTALGGEMAKGNGNNYFKLRDLATVMNFGVT